MFWQVNTLFSHGPVGLASHSFSRQEIRNCVTDDRDGAIMKRLLLCLC